jgi:hypothetical protein
MRPRRWISPAELAWPCERSWLSGAVLPSKDIPARRIRRWDFCFLPCPARDWAVSQKKGWRHGVYPTLSFWPRSTMAPKRHRRTRPSHRGL